MADGDGDEIMNLLEYALASDPNTASTDDLPMAAYQDLSVGGSIDQYLTLTFRRQPASKDLVYSVGVSNDLNTWQETVAVLVSSSDNNDGTISETWRADVPVGTDPRQFMRLKVEG